MAGHPSSHESLRLNGAIRASRVRVVAEDGAMMGVMSLHDALSEAQARGLDLVEVSPAAQPPVCRIIDYGKFRYREQKRRVELRRKQKTVDLKEIKMRPATDAHDYDFKLRSMKKFLEHGDKVKVTVRMRGRELAHQERAFALLQRVEADIAELGRVESAPTADGRQILMIVAPQKKNK
ncbi:MAG: translation initiation factor IF-3 [Alphaproteobacteria bacterium GM202ARS2]|nr:translation initiation factor IF-3 [Alphaproteobacteria bacterium GM202ARS2]